MMKKKKFEKSIIRKRNMKGGEKRRKSKGNSKEKDEIENERTAKNNGNYQV